MYASLVHCSDVVFQTYWINFLLAFQTGLLPSSLCQALDVWCGHSCSSTSLQKVQNIRRYKHGGDDRVSTTTLRNLLLFWTSLQTLFWLQVLC
jgi:hypothetical protein